MIMNFDMLPGKNIKFLLLRSFLECSSFDLTIYPEENFLSRIKNLFVDKSYISETNFTSDLSDLRMKLIKEIYLYADSINAYNIYKNLFLLDMNQDNFCETILKM